MTLASDAATTFAPVLMPAARVAAFNSNLSSLFGQIGTASLPSYTVLTVPSASLNSRQLIYVSDGAASKRIAYSDGTAWRWVSTDAAIS